MTQADDRIPENAGDTGQDPMLQWVTFRLAGETYGINVIQIQEVLRLSEIAPVPGAPDHVLGIINLRGNVVTVIDARRRFGLPPQEPDDLSRIVITENDGMTVGILVDSVAEVVNLRLSEIESPPNVGKDESSRYIQGVHSEGDRILILVDLNRLLEEEERSEAAPY
ncbi:MAG: purine-binding chemotaxis protein CheW [Gammaproteobacteria bacterium]|nr:MAG: purine-binding chemotaxis protein CheW [Gammaproteobacteria bacterium]